ncbi:MAG: hypothetical protein WCF09_03700 [Gallionella sp.]
MTETESPEELRRKYDDLFLFVLRLIHADRVERNRILDSMRPGADLQNRAQIDEDERALRFNIDDMLEAIRGAGEGVVEFMREEKKVSFKPVQKMGTQKKVEDAQQRHADIKTMNADLLARPASEGWGSKKKRAEHISKKTGKSFLYISKLLAIPRKTNQT